MSRRKLFYCPLCQVSINAVVNAAVASELKRLAVKGGKARALALTPERRSTIARQAALARHIRK